MADPGNPHLASELLLGGAPLDGARRAAIVLHGRAQSPEYMLEHLVSPLDVDDVAYLLPRAHGASWYPGRYFDPRERNQPGLDHALAAVDHALDRLHGAGFGPERIVLVGFSQGGCLACEHIALRPGRCAGAAVLTGCLIGDAEERSLPRLPDLAIYLGTREGDDWVSAAHVRRTGAAFARAGADVTLDVRAPGPHQIDAEDVAATRALLLP
jgi:predicted esterase